MSTSNTKTGQAQFGKIKTGIKKHKDNPSAHYFVGKYVKAIRQVAIASMLSNTHASFQSPPGWGKTDILDFIGRQVAGDDHYNRLDLMPSSNPAIFTGVDDPKQIINHGRFVKVTDGTPYDPKMRIVLADELFRANDPTFDAALHAFDPKKQDHCVVWAANNFVAKGKRIDALLDRISLWFWLAPEMLDSDNILMAMMGSIGKPKVGGWLPTWAEVSDIRSAKPGPNAIEAVQDTLRELVSEGVQEGFDVGHPRAMSQWWRIVFYNTVAHTGTADFNKVPDAVMGILQYAYGSRSIEEARRWASVVTAITDKLQAEIDRILAENVKEFKRVAAIEDAANRTQEAVALGLRLTAAQKTLESQFGTRDQRVKDTMRLISSWHSAALLGDTDAIDSF